MLERDQVVPSALQRAWAATGIAAATTAWYVWGHRHFGATGSDFDQLWFAARALIHGRDPYRLIGPGLEVNQAWPLYYPVTGILPALPLSLLTLPVARLVYCFGIAWAFAFLIARGGWYRLTAVLSGSYLSAMSLLQWAPLAACALLAPAWFGWMVTGKPNLGLVTMSAADSWRSFALFVCWSVATLIVSLLIFPHWFFEWRDIVGTATRVQPYAVRPGGLLLLLALVRYRRPEARWLATLFAVPNTASSPDALVLFAFPHSFRQGLVLALLTHAINFYLAFQPKPSSDEALTALNSGATLVFAFLPALLVVLLRKNEWPSDKRSSMRALPD